MSSDEIPLTDVSANEPDVEVTQPKPPSMAMFRTLVLTALLSGFLVVMVVQWATPYIEANQKAATEAAVFNVVKGASISKAYTLTPDSLLEGHSHKQKAPGADTFLVYAGYNDSGRLLGVAVPGVATGYAGPVKIMFGYNPELEAITAYQVLTMTETPGLGDKVLTDENFLANFNQLDARIAVDGSGLANAIVTVKNGTKSNPWEIDAISGSTVTSKAIGKAINLSAQKWLPLIYQYRDQMAQGGTQ